MASIGDEGFDLADIPKMMSVPESHIPNVLLKGRGIQRFARFWIALIGQLTIAMDDMITASL